MNIKNLRQIYQKQGTLTLKPVPPIQQKPINANTINYNSVSIQKTVQPAKQTQTISIVQPSNKNFLEELNKKLDPNNSRNSFSRTGGFSYISPPPVVQQEKKKQVELSFDQIMQEAAQQPFKQSSHLKMRYGINEHNPHSKEERNLFQIQKVNQPVSQNSSFSQLLQSMIKGLNLIQNCSPQIRTQQENQQFRPISIYEYGEINTSLEQKMKRIDFVMDVIFKETQFQIIPQSQLRQKKPVKQSERQQSRVQAKKQPKISAIPRQSIVGPVKQQIKALPKSFIIEQPIPINGNFLAELSSKIKKKQTASLTTQMHKSNKESDIKNKELIQLPQKSMTQSINIERSVTPVKRKKAKQHQNFDEI